MFATWAPVDTLQTLAAFFSLLNFDLICVLIRVKFETACHSLAMPLTAGHFSTIRIHMFASCCHITSILEWSWDSCEPTSSSVGNWTYCTVGVMLTCNHISDG